MKMSTIFLSIIYWDFYITETTLVEFALCSCPTHLTPYLIPPYNNYSMEMPTRFELVYELLRSLIIGARCGSRTHYTAFAEPPLAV